MSFITDFFNALLGRRKPLPTFEPLSYGSDPLQKLDVYRPPNIYSTDHCPVLFMVHGGDWENTKGDKANANVIANKVAWLVPQGWIVVSINYRLYPAVSPLQEAQDVQAALSYVQRKVGASRYVLMGHSAGAHLVALVTAWGADVDGTICLDGIYDIEAAKRTGLALFDPFGDDSSKWPAESPIDCIDDKTGPWLFCHATEALRTKQATDMAARVKSFGGSASLAGFNLSHEDMNATVGLPGALTDAVGAFLGL